MIAFVDRNGDTVYLTHEEVAECLKRMGNDSGWYVLVKWSYDMESVGGPIVLALRAIEPTYTWFSRIKRLFRKNDEEKFVWLFLKHNNAHAIYVA